MNRAAKVIVAVLLGLAFPFLVALANVLPFLRRDTSYEVVLEWMLFSAILSGGIVALGTKRR